MQELLGLLGLSGGGLLTKAAYDRMGDAGDYAHDESKKIADMQKQLTDFKGYGITGNTGTSGTDAAGNTQFNLSPEMQGYADSFRNASWGSMMRAMEDPTQMQNDIYGRIRAMQQPEENRARLGLENRLVNQGRAGVRTAAYGGTPEQLAQEKAIQEAQNSAAYQALGESRAAQRQFADLSGMFGQQQFLPSDQLRKDYAMGTQGYGFKDVADRTGAGNYGETLMSGLDAKLAGSLGQGNLMGELGSSLIGGGSGMFSSAINKGVDTLSEFGGNLWNTIFG